MAEKKYYWLKLQNDFFAHKEIKKLRKIAGGDTYTIIYLKMLLLSLQNQGILYYDGVEDSFVEEIALELDEDTENVRFTMLFLKQHSLIEERSETEVRLPATINSIGGETSGAIRVRRHRARQKALPCNEPVTLLKQNDNGEIDTDLELELKKEKELKLKEKIEQETFFNTFWETYPKKLAKKDAIKAFAKIKMTEELLQEITSSVKAMKATKSWKEGYAPNPATYLNGERWKDEVPAERSNYGTDNRKFGSDNETFRDETFHMPGEIRL